MQPSRHSRDIVEEQKHSDNSYNSYNQRMAMICGQITQIEHDSLTGPAGVHMMAIRLKEILLIKSLPLNQTILMLKSP